MPNCQTTMHILTMALTISVATFVEMVLIRISGLLGVSTGKEPPRVGNSAISLVADPKNPYYILLPQVLVNVEAHSIYSHGFVDNNSGSSEICRLTQVTTTEVPCETKTRYTRR
jgi:hypothetical protein